MAVSRSLACCRFADHWSTVPCCAQCPTRMPVEEAIARIVVRMNAMQRQRGALVLVDYQQRLMRTLHDAGTVVAEALFLGRVAHALGVPVLGTEQNPQGLGPNLPAVRELCRETIGKMHFDGCRDGLLGRLHAARPELGEVV